MRLYCIIFTNKVIPKKFAAFYCPCLDLMLISFFVVHVREKKMAYLCENRYNIVIYRVVLRTQEELNCEMDAILSEMGMGCGYG